MRLTFNLFTSCRRTSKQPAVEQRSQAENEACSINIEDESAEANIATAPSTSTFRQSNMNAFVKQPVTKAQSEKITKLITNVIVGDLRPINFVEGKYFRALINYLEPSYDLPSRHTFTKSIEDLYKNAKPSLISDLSKVMHIALTFDMWTSSRMQSFLGIPAHYVSPNNAKLATALLAVKEVGDAHTGQNIASWLKTVI